MKAEELEKLKQVADVCTKCKLSTTRTKVVFGEGNPEAELLFSIYFYCSLYSLFDL